MAGEDDNNSNASAPAAAQAVAPNYVESLLISDLWYVQPTDKVSISLPSYKPCTTDLQQFIAYYQAKVDGGMPQETAISRALNHLATPAANFLRESSGASWEFKQRKDFKLFMKHVKRIFKVESSDGADHPLRSNQWYVKQRAFPHGTPRNHQLMVMSSDAFNVTKQFAKVIIPDDDNSRDVITDGAAQLAWLHCLRMGVLGPEDEAEAPNAFPTDRDRRSMIVGAAMAFQIEAFKSFQLNYVPGSAAPDLQQHLETSIRDNANPCDIFNDFLHKTCELLTKMTTVKGDSLAQHFNRTNKNYAIMAVNATHQNGNNGPNGHGNNNNGNKRNNRGRGRGGRGRGRGNYNPRNGNNSNPQVQNQGRNQGQQQANVGAVESQQLEGQSNSPNQTHTQQEQPTNPQETPAPVDAVEFLDYFPHPNQY